MLSFAVGCLNLLFTSFTPASGPVGNIVKHYGFKFRSVPEFNVVHFGC